jgi:hypothetical protein
MTISYTIGGMMVFPGNRIQGKWTINQARGCLKRISDQFELTVQCIRRHYARQSSPLGETLARYEDFFALSEDFSGYVDFFLLQDLVTDDRAAVTFFIPFDDFRPPRRRRMTPRTESTDVEIQFIEARNRRIERQAAAPR